MPNHKKLGILYTLYCSLSRLTRPGTTIFLDQAPLNLLAEFMAIYKFHCAVFTAKCIMQWSCGKSYSILMRVYMYEYDNVTGCCTLL